MSFSKSSMLKFAGIEEGYSVFIGIGSFIVLGRIYCGGLRAFSKLFFSLDAFAKV
jgi:hypothetical protein